MRTLTRSLLGFVLSLLLGLAVLSYRTRNSADSDSTTLTTAAARTTLVGRVVRVSDGDTIAVQVTAGEKPTKIRILGIDAPEKKQPFGEVCRRKLASWIAGKEVEILAFNQDRYGRVLGKVLEIAHGERPQDFGLEMVASGCAWHYKHFARNQPHSDRATYARAEQTARLSRLGLWKQTETAQAPWDYRRQLKGRRLATSGESGETPQLQSPAESRASALEELPPTQ